MRDILILFSFYRNALIDIGLQALLSILLEACYRLTGSDIKMIVGVL